MTEQEEQERSWKPIHQLMFDYLKHLGYDDSVVEEFKKQCLDANYPYFNPLDDWISVPATASFRRSSSEPVQIGKVTTIDPTKVYRLISGEARLFEEFGNFTWAETAETTRGTLDDWIFGPTSFPSSSSETAHIGKVISIDHIKVYRLVSEEARLVEEVENVPLDDLIPFLPVPYELLDPKKVHMFGELLGSPPHPSDPSHNF